MSSVRAAAHPPPVSAYTPSSIQGDAAVPPAKGTTLDQYRLDEPIGAGGMGEVWKAIDLTLDRPVAVKILPDAFSSDPQRVARFEREAKVLASLNHPGIAMIYGLHSAGGVHFLAME